MPAPGATISYNGVALDTPPYSIASVDGLIGGDELRSHDLFNIDRDGVIAGRDLKGGKTITLTINVYADNETAFNTAVMGLQAAFAYPAAVELPLTFTLPGLAGGVAAQINARPRKLALPYLTGWRGGRYGQAVVELYATDGAKYSAAESSQMIALAQLTGGFTFPIIFPLIFGGGTLGIATIVNSGNVTTMPRFTITGPVSNPEIRSETLNRNLTVGLSVAGGDYLLIDTATRSVLLNGTASRYSSLTSAEWFGLIPGNNELRFTGSSAGTPVATVYWRNSWL